MILPRRWSPAKPGGAFRATRFGGSLVMVFRRLALVIMVIGGGVLTTAAPAAAHAGGLTATDSRGRVVSVTPEIPGLEVVAIENGARLRLRNGTGAPVTVVVKGGAEGGPSAACSRCELY